MSSFNYSRHAGEMIAERQIEPKATAMKTSYDPETDALYVRFARAAIVESEEIRPGFVLDYDVDGRIIAVEILEASEHLAGGTDLRGLNAA